MSSQELLKKLTGTKFLFDKELISYPDLVNLLEDKGFNTKFIQKPITDNLEVHSLYIKPELEIAYLAKSSTSDSYYATAGYSCVTFEEQELQFVLDILGYKAPVKTDTNVKKSKYITLETEEKIIKVKKKEICVIYYNKKSNVLNITSKRTNQEYSKVMNLDEYTKFIEELNS